MPSELASDFESDLRRLLHGPAEPEQTEKASGRIIVAPGGPRVFLEPALVRFSPIETTTALKRSLPVRAADVIRQGRVAPIDVDPFGQVRSVCFERLDELDGQRDAEQVIVDAAHKCIDERNISFIIYSIRDPAEIDLKSKKFFLDKSKFAIENWGKYSNEMNRQQILSKEVLRLRLSELDEEQFSINNPESIDLLWRIFVETSWHQPLAAVGEVFDPVTGLKLPPDPRTPYQDRSAKYKTRIELDEFLRKEWGDYTRHHLLYADHLRLLDFPLYKALQYRAKTFRKSFSAFLFKHGIFGREHVVNPPRGFERQADLLKVARLRSRAETLGKTAQSVRKGLRPSTGRSRGNRRK